MRRSSISLAILAGLLFSQGARAGAYTDKLTQCAVTSLTDADRLALSRWMFAGFAASPALKDMALVSAVQRDKLDAAAAAILQRLFVKDCRTDAIAALRNEGGDSVPTAFRTVGQAAALGLMADPDASAALMAMKTHMDPAAWDALTTEAGAPAK